LLIFFPDQISMFNKKDKHFVTLIHTQSCVCYPALLESHKHISYKEKSCLMKSLSQEKFPDNSYANSKLR